MNHEDVAGHPVDESDNLVYDPGCWFCRDKTAQPPPGSEGRPLPAWLEGKLDRVAGANQPEEHP